MDPDYLRHSQIPWSQDMNPEYLRPSQIDFSQQVNSQEFQNLNFSQEYQVPNDFLNENFEYGQTENFQTEPSNFEFNIEEENEENQEEFNFEPNEQENFELIQNEMYFNENVNLTSPDNLQEIFSWLDNENLQNNTETTEVVGPNHIDDSSLHWTRFWHQQRRERALDPLLQQINQWRQANNIQPLNIATLAQVLEGTEVSDESVLWTTRFLDGFTPWTPNPNLTFDFDTPVGASPQGTSRHKATLERGMFVKSPIKGIFLGNHSSALKNSCIVDKMIKALLKSKIIEKCRPRAIFPIGLVKKNDGTPRLIHDLRELNRQLPFINTHYPSMEVAFKKFEQSNAKFFCKIDLKNGYFHIPINKKFSKWFGLKWKGVSYAFQRLPFGLSMAPAIFQSITKKLLEKWKNNCLVYLDDFLLFADSFEKTHQITKEVLLYLVKNHWRINFKKSILIPQQQVDFLGFSLSGTKQNWSYSKKFALVLKVLFKNWNTISQDKLKQQKAVGFLSFMLSPFRMGYSFLKHLLLTSKFTFLANWLLKVTSFSWKGFKYKKYYMYVDATPQLIGLYPPSKTVILPPGIKIFEAEALAVLLSFKYFPAFVLSDNQAVVHAFNKGSSSNIAVNWLIMIGATFCLKHNYKPTIRWIPSENNLADLPSREIAKLSTPLYKEGVEREFSQTSFHPSLPSNGPVPSSTKVLPHDADLLKENLVSNFSLNKFLVVED